MSTNPEEQIPTDAHVQSVASPQQQTAGVPSLFVCHGDERGPRVHPCRRVQEALHAAGIEYEKTIAAHGSPIPFLRKGSREELAKETGTTKLPVLKLADGTVIEGSREIIAWVGAQP
jgi:Glutathione S-transferase, N-terminal domain